MRLIGVMNRLVIVVCMLLASGVQASMRCGNHLVAVGDSKMDVLIRCGPPALAEPYSVATYERYGFGGMESNSYPLEVWHYNCGRGILVKRLLFEGGFLRAVDAGRIRGTGPQRCN